MKVDGGEQVPKLIERMLAGELPVNPAGVGLE